MTTIAYKDGIVAADTQETFGDRKIKSAGKIFRVPSGPNKGHVLCLTGASFVGQKLVEWYTDPKGKEPPIVAADPDDDEALVEFLVITPDRRLFLFNETCALVPFEADHYAVGSGGDYAIGAMDAGKSAIEAVKIACRHDCNSSLPLHIMRLVPPPNRRANRRQRN